MRINLKKKKTRIYEKLNLVRQYNRRLDAEKVIF